MERHEGAFACSPNEDEDHGGCNERPVDRRFNDNRERCAAGLHDEDDQANQHDEPTKCGDKQRLNSRATALFAIGVVANEEVGEHACDLPEDEHDDDVVGGHEPIHDPGKEE